MNPVLSGLLTLLLTSTETSTTSITASKEKTDVGQTIRFCGDDGDSPLCLDIAAQVFGRVRGTRGEGNVWNKSYALTRARLSATLRYGDILRANIEPDFAGATCASAGAVCDEAEVSDVFLEISPVSGFDLRVGQAKSPYGAIESTSEWRLPAQRRGLVSELVTNRLRFGGRRLGARARLKASDWQLKPSFEFGGYTDAENDNELDIAARAGVKIISGMRAEMAVYARANARADGGYGLSNALAVTYEKRSTFVVVEFVLGRARLLSIAGTTTQDATFIAARALFAHGFELTDTLELEPYLGIDIFDPNGKTGSDRGGAVRTGLNFYFARIFRLAGELDVRGGQSAFVSPNQTILTFFIGASLD